MIERKRVVFLSPEDDVWSNILRDIETATKGINILAYGLTHEGLLQCLIDLHGKGKDIEIVADKTQSAGAAQKVFLARAKAAGIPVWIGKSPSGNIMHEKVILIDIVLGSDANESRAIYGSFNFSQSAESQANHCAIDNDPSVCALFYRQYTEMKLIAKAL